MDRICSPEDLSVDDVVAVHDITGKHKWDALVVRVFSNSIGVRSSPRKEGTTTINCSPESMEILALPHPYLTFRKLKQK